MRRLSSPLLARVWLVSALALCSCGDDGPQPPFALDLPITHSQLPNGLELVIVPNHTAPLVTALVAFRVGASVEDASLNGYSHLFEHMMFQGSAAVPDSQEFRDQLDALGVSSNATTGTDRVTYYFTAPRDSLEPALELFAGALREPELDEARLDKERGVVLSEFDLNESSSDFISYHTGLSALFGDYTVHVDPLGSREVVTNVSRDELLGMHRRYYVPDNALLVLSGDVTASTARALAERYFGDWSAGDEAEAPMPPEPPAFTRNRYELVTAEVANTTIDLWWRGPTADDDPEGFRACGLFAAATLQTDHPFRSLVQQDLALSAQVSLRSFRKAGYVRVQLTVPPGNEDAVMSQLGRVLSVVFDNDAVNTKQLRTARRQAFSSYIQVATVASYLPHALADAFGSGSTMDFFDSVDALYGTDRSAIQRSLSKYIAKRPKVIVLTASRAQLNKAGIDRSWLQARDPL